MNEHHNIQKATIYALLSALCFSIMALFIKINISNTTTVMTVFFRFAVSFSYLVILLSLRKIKNKPISIKTNHFYLHCIRAFFAVSGMFLLYYSLRFIPLVSANLLSMTTYSAKAPGIWWPIIFKSLHRLYFPCRQNTHLWQRANGSTITASPILFLLTFFPAAVITPEHSWPRIMG